MNKPNNKKFNLSRRDFLRASGATGVCAAASSTAMMSTLLNMSLIKSAAAATSDLSGYKALVCVFLHGGMDSFNMLMPYDYNSVANTGEYADYAKVRTNMAIPYADLAATNFTDDLSGRPFAVHPGMGGVHQLYQNQNLGFMANVGTLVVPTNRASYDAKNGLPVGLFSHSDQQNSWQSSIPQSRTQITGVFGRMADLITDTVNGNPAISMNISTDHLNVLQTGYNVVPYAVHRTNGASVLAGYNGTGRRDKILTEATDGLLSQNYSDLLKSTYSQMYRGSIDAAEQFNQEAKDYPLVTSFASKNLSQQLQMVAKTIAARGPLQQTRQVFFVERGGWDHHSNLHANLNNLLPEVNDALSSFYEATVELGVENEVTTFTASDFSRTLTSNGSGSDHGWGSNMILMGGDVDGRKVHGQYPVSLDPAFNDLDVGRGRLIPTTSVDEYYAELAMWFGIGNDTSLETILPNIRNFYPSDATDRPIGFMKS